MTAETAVFHCFSGLIFCVTSLLVATRNAHKAREFQELLGTEFELRDLSTYPNIPETIESGKTLEENAILKAIAVSEKHSGFVIGDDSGLEVDALGGGPGIFSARYAGKRATDKENIDKLLGELARKLSWRNFPSCGPSKRQVGNLPHSSSARFRCVLALARKGNIVATFEGIVKGRIIDVPKGKHGFGYDPVFVPTGFTETFAELASDIKNRISHRAKVVGKLKQYLRDIS